MNKSFLSILKKNFTRYNMKEIGMFILAIPMLLILCTLFMAVFILTPIGAMYLLTSMGVGGIWLLLPYSLWVSILVGLYVADEVKPPFKKLRKRDRLLSILITALIIHFTMLESYLVGLLIGLQGDDFLVSIGLSFIILVFINATISDTVLESYKEYKEEK